METNIADGDDEAIVFDGEVPELPEVGEMGESDTNDEENGLAKGAAEVAEVAVSKAKALSDLWLVDSAVERRVRAEATCISCGATGHKWPKCRARNIEPMLVKIQAMLARDEVTVLPPRLWFRPFFGPHAS